MLIAAVLAIVGAAYFRTQILQNTNLVLRSQDNRLRAIPIPAARGTVYDRNGAVLAETVTGYRLLVQPMPPDSVRRRLSAIAPAVPVDSAGIQRIIGELEAAPGMPVEIADLLTFEQVAWIKEHRTALEGVTLQPHPVRSYPGGRAVAHLIGYVGQISKGELADSSWWNYRMGQAIGKSGIERAYESRLGGTPGEYYVEVDSQGRVVGTLAEGASIPPVPGRDLRLTVDLDLQRFARSVFPEGTRGAVVALEPGTGEVLALYSHPAYDPNILANGVSVQRWDSLNGNPARPLLNRVTSGIYAPGSTWKVATALIGLESGVVTPEAEMPIPCTGGFRYAGRYSRCWKEDGHGSLNLAEAIAHSCNVYFYQLGIRLGLNQLAREGTRLGFGQPTGIDLPDESAGIFPENADAYEERFGHDPTPSEVMRLAIGQGPNAQTPLRMAQFYSAIANDGTARAPHLRADVRTPVETDLQVGRERLDAVIAGLAAVVEEGGTAYLSSPERWRLYGKTGTAENSADPDRPHASFTGFAGTPDADPEIVVSVIVEFEEHGSSAAAPIAARVADYYLNELHGVRR